MVYLPCYIYAVSVLYIIRSGLCNTADLPVFYFAHRDYMMAILAKEFEQVTGDFMQKFFSTYTARMFVERTLITYLLCQYLDIERFLKIVKQAEKSP